MPTFLLFFLFPFSSCCFPIGLGFTLTARRSAHTHQSLSIKTTPGMMNAFSSNAPKPLSPGCLTARHVPRGEENTSTFPIRSPKKGGGMSTQRALELIRLMPKPKYTGWRSGRQKAEDARAKAKAEATRLKQKMEEDEKKKQKKCPELTQTRRCT